MKKIFSILFTAMFAVSTINAESKVIDFTAGNQLNLPTATKAAEYYKENFTVTDSETGYTFTFTADSNNGWAYQNSNSTDTYLIMGKAGASMSVTTTETLDSIIVTGRSGASGSVKWSVYEGEEELTLFTGAKEVYTIYTTGNSNIYTITVGSDANMQITKIEFFYTPTGITTSIEDAYQYDSTVKVLKDGHLYIIKDNKTYNVQGVCL